MMKEYKMDLDKTAWEGIQKAAKESTWMPKEYCMNDWLSDVRDFLRNGPHKQPVEPEYKWLAMDGNTPFVCTKKPMWKVAANCWGSWGVADTILKPSFLKPGQLWEKLRRVNTSVDLDFINGAEEWNGYWWRLVEDHGEQPGEAEQESVWIPWEQEDTENFLTAATWALNHIDAICGVSEDDKVDFEALRHYVEKLTPPPSESCESVGCYWYMKDAPHIMTGNDLYPSPFCFHAKVHNPEHGQPGCVYERGQGDE
jgi:hypothetical protein